MIRQVAREAWAASPRKVIAAVVLTPLACLYGWAVLVVVIGAAG